MSDIFISYAKSDYPRIEPLVRVLEGQGWSVWWDRTILPGNTWDQVLETALADARCVIVLWSPNSIQSDWVLAEADEAKRRGILVPALLDDVNIPLGFRRIQAANLIDGSGALSSAGIEQLVRAVSSVLSNETVPIAQSFPQIAEDPRLAVKRDKAGKGDVGVGAMRSRRRFLLVGIPLLICLISFGSYLAIANRRVQQSPQSSPIAGEVRENPKDGLSYVWIPPGTFAMGCSPGDDECDADEKPPHEVAITSGFWLGKTEVTVTAVNRFWDSTRSSYRIVVENPDILPAVEVGWDEANGYCQWAGLRLPTEAEWEYAARATTKGARYGPLDRIAWYDGNKGGKERVRPVGGKMPNAWGLHDMLGNAWEWVADIYKEATEQPRHQPHILRGGSWNNVPRAVRVSNRGRGESAQFSGFRCAGELN